MKAGGVDVSPGEGYLRLTSDTPSLRSCQREGGSYLKHTQLSELEVHLVIIELELVRNDAV